MGSRHCSVVRVTPCSQSFHPPNGENLINTSGVLWLEGARLSKYEWSHLSDLYALFGFLVTQVSWHWAFEQGVFLYLQ